jgi:hypothetical protein
VKNAINYNVARVNLKTKLKTQWSATQSPRYIKKYPPSKHISVVSTGMKY